MENMDICLVPGAGGSSLLSEECMCNGIATHDVMRYSASDSDELSYYNDRTVADPVNCTLEYTLPANTSRATNVKLSVGYNKAQGIKDEAIYYSAKNVSWPKDPVDEWFVRYGSTDVFVDDAVHVYLGDALRAKMHGDNVVSMLYDELGGTSWRCSAVTRGFGDKLRGVFVVCYDFSAGKGAALETIVAGTVAKDGGGVEGRLFERIYRYDGVSPDWEVASAKLLGGVRSLHAPAPRNGDSGGVGDEVLDWVCEAIDMHAGEECRAKVNGMRDRLIGSNGSAAGRRWIRSFRAG